MNSSYNYVKYVPRIFLKKYSSPMYVIFFVTKDCNAYCRHCLLGGSFSDSNDLSLEEIEKISQNMDDFLFLLLTGGEPFLREDLEEIVKIFYANNSVQNVIIPTNGFFTERVVEFVKNVLKSCPTLDLGIDVSMDGIGEDHDQIRGLKGLFNAATKTFKELKKLEQQHSRFHVSVETTVSAYNQDKLLDLYSYIKENWGNTNFFPLLTRGNARDQSSKDVDISKYEEYTSVLEEELMDGKLKGYYSFPFSDFINAKRIVRHKLISDIVRRRRTRPSCYAGSLFATIFNEGEVLACELLDKKVLGYLREENYNFRKIWSGEKAKEVRKYINTSGSCAHCTFECPLSVNILFNFKMWPALLKEWCILKKNKIKKARAYGG